MAIPETPTYPIEMACSQCKLIVWVTDNHDDFPVGEVAACPRCKTILEKPDVVHQRIIDEAKAQ